MATVKRGCRQRALRTVSLHSLDDGGRERQTGLLRGLSSHFVDTHHVLVANLGMFHRTDHDMLIVTLKERPLTSQRTLVLSHREGTQRTVQHRRLAHRLSHRQCTGMAYQTVGEHMMALVLMGLIGIAATRLGGIEQRQSQGVVRRFIPSVTAIVEDGDAIGAGDIREVCPFMTAYLIAGIGIGRPLDAAQPEVVGCHAIADRQWEFGFQQGILGTPVNHILDIYLVGKSTLVEVEILTDVGVAIALRDAQRLTDSTLFHTLHLHTLVDGQRFFVECTLVNLPGRPSL